MSLGSSNMDHSFPIFLLHTCQSPSYMSNTHSSNLSLQHMDCTYTSVLARVPTRDKYVTVKYHSVPLEVLIKILQQLIPL